MTRYALNLPIDLKREAEDLAKKQGISLNQFILWSVAEKVVMERETLDDPKFPLITYRQGGSGISRPVIRGTALHVQTVALAVNKFKEKPAAFARNYGVKVAQVREALGFYDAHKWEIDQNIAYENNLEKQYKREKAKKNDKAAPAS